MKVGVKILMALGFLLAGGIAYNIIHEVYPKPPIVGALGALVVWIVGWRLISRRGK